MTITIPPPRARSRRPRRADEAVPPERAARGGMIDDEAVVETSARGDGDRERLAATPSRRGSGDTAARPGRGERATARRGGTSSRGADPAPARQKARPAAGAVPGRTGSAAPAAKAPATTRGPARPATRPAPSRTAPPRKAARPAPPRGRTPFVLLVVGLLGGALVSLLLLNTVLAQDAFTLSELQQNNRQLNERRQALQEDIARESSPEVLHRKALGLGMKDSRRPAFIDARTGRVTEGGTRPPGVPDDVVAAAAAAGVTGAPGAIAPPAGDTTTPSAAGTAARPGAGTGGGRR